MFVELRRVSCKPWKPWLLIHPLPHRTSCQAGDVQQCCGFDGPSVQKQRCRNDIGSFAPTPFQKDAKKPIFDRFRPVSGQTRCCTALCGSCGRSTAGSRLKPDVSNSGHRNRDVWPGNLLARVETVQSPVVVQTYITYMFVHCQDLFVGDAALQRAALVGDE